MAKPIIGITPQYDYDHGFIRIGENYMKAIKAAGGIPYLLPLEINQDDVGEIVDLFHGFVFSGGPDLDPFLFGEETIPQAGLVIDKRDNLEQKIFEAAYKKDKPLLGICRGMQAFNIFLGGTIYQDIETLYTSSISIGHYQKSANEVLSHSVEIVATSLLDEILNKETIKVNSFHHQGVKKLAPSLEAAAFSRDLLAEAIYSKTRNFLLAVQWHPEHLYNLDENQFKIFRAFIEAC